MHPHVNEQKTRFSLPLNGLQSCTTGSASYSLPSRSDSLRPRKLRTETASDEFPGFSSTSSIPKSKHLSQPSISECGFFGRLQRAFRRSASFDKRHSAYNRPLSGQLMKSTLSAADFNTTLTHAKRTTSFDSAAHNLSFVPATYSMTSTPMPSSTHPSRGPSDRSSHPLTTSSYRIPLKIRDFAYAASDPRHQGLGEDGRGTLNIPIQNRVRVIYQMLLDDVEYQAWKAAAISADQDIQDSDAMDVDEYENEDEEDIDEDDNRGWNGRWSLPSDEPNYENEEDDEEGEEDAGPLSPGLYRALYPFIPEGSREMALNEEQVVRVVGRGGGAGWAVVVVDGVDDKGKRRSSQKERQLALVPESYLEPIALDEDDP
ncbi:hypothetical protein F5879DRAFT_242557 [Lentinula edodes]|nr:hypothetical protein F5879DRAFT_242557 [Lentinula edodes]